MSMDARGIYRTKSQRPPAPWKASDVGINVSFHHIIPHSLMREAWQGLATNSQLGKCQVALLSYMRLIKVANPREWLKAMTENALSFDQQEQLDRHLSWPPWNIVEGPHYRVDDPKSERHLDEYTAALTGTELNRQKRIKDVFLGLQIFNAATEGGTFSEEAAAAVASVMNNAERTLVAGEVIMYRPAMWVEVPATAANNSAGVKWWKKKPGISLYDRRQPPS